MSHKSLAAEAMTDDDLDRLIVQSITESDGEAANGLWLSIETAEAIAAANKQLAEQATFRANNAQAEAARIKERILAQLSARNLKDLPCTFGRFARTANGGHQPLRITGDYPDEFARVKREADLEKVRAAIKEGEILDFVEVLPRGEHLRLK